MARVTADEVKEIIETDWTDIDAFINTANLIVNELAEDPIHGPKVSDDKLKEMERWMSAHFLSVGDNRLSSEKIGNAQSNYHLPSLGEGFKSTFHGQQLLLLDKTGYFSQLGKIPVKIEAIDY